MKGLRVWAGVVAISAGAVVAPSRANASAQPAACPAHVTWATFGGNDARTGINMCESRLGTGNVGSIHLLWRRATAGKMLAQPTYLPSMSIKGGTHNVLFVSDEAGLVQALDATTGAVLWKRQFGMHASDCSPATGVTSGVLLNPATDTGYLVDGLDNFYAIDLRTGSNKAGFTPVNVGDPAVDHVYGGVTMNGNVGYIATASYCDASTYYGRVDAIDLTQHKIVDTFAVVPSSTGQYAGGIWGPGGVSVDTANGAVYTATGNSLPSEHAGYAEQVVRLGAKLNVVAANYTPFAGGDVDYGATPLLFQPAGCPPMLAAKNKSGVMTVYNRNKISSGPLQRIQVAGKDGQFNGIPAYAPANQMVVVTNSSDSAPFTHGIIGFSVGSNCKLSMVWEQAAGINKSSVSPPTIANGVVYYGDGPGRTLRAFNVATGAPLWTSGTRFSGPVYAAPTIVDGHVFAGTWDNHIYAFGL